MHLEPWQWTSVILCGYGLFKEFRPSEPFFVSYLLDYKDVTSDQLVHKAFPSYTYTYLATLAVVFLLTDYLRYRIVIILEAIAYVACWSVLTWGNGLISVIFVEILYGIVSSTEVAYFTYIYAKVDREHYPKVTSYTHSAFLCGKFLAGLLGQLLVEFKAMDYHQLNYLSLGSVSIALVFSLMLPRVQQSIYFHREIDASLEDGRGICVGGSRGGQGGIRKLDFRDKVKATKYYMVEDLKAAYSNMYVVKWTGWWAVAFAGHLLVGNFIQSLWEVVAEEGGDGKPKYNGAVEAAQTLISALFAFGVGYMRIPWKTWGEPLMSVSAGIQCVALIWMSRTNDIYVAYGCYILYRILFQVIFAVANSEVAQEINDDSFGLIFGINTFIALVFQTVVTVVVADEVGFSLNERDQFLTYGIGFGVLSAVFTVILVWSVFKRCRSK